MKRSIGVAVVLIWAVAGLGTLTFAWPYNGGTYGSTYQGVENEFFVHSEETNSAMAACFVAVEESDEAFACCLCAATGDRFAFCSADSLSCGDDGLALGFGEAFGAACTSLGSDISTSYYSSDLLIDVSASCTLQQEELAFEAFDGGYDLGFLLGHKARYAAVYMWPEVNGDPVGDPVRLCARGTESLLVALDGYVTNENFGGIEFTITEEDLGLAGGFQWAVKNVGCGHQYVSVKFIVVAAVDAALLDCLGDGVHAAGVLAMAKLKDRGLHVTAYENVKIVDANDD